MSVYVSYVLVIGR